jgi:exodeoxyribonuclease VII small subunit
MSKKPTFEEAMVKLEEIIDLLDEGGLPLEELEAKFMEGMKLSEFCESRLREVEMRVEKIMEKETGEAIIEPFEEEDDK